MSDGQQTAVNDEARPNGDAPANGEAPEQTVDVAALTAERDEYLEQLQRTRADFVNYRRRTEQEREQVRARANRDLLLHLVPVLDDFRRALGAIPADQRETGWVAGVTMIERKLAAVLERAGVAEIDALGQPFDPAQHEAVATADGGGSTVVEVYQPGYRLGQSVLRPAMVKVGDAPAKGERDERADAGEAGT